MSKITLQSWDLDTHIKGELRDNTLLSIVFTLNMYGLNNILNGVTDNKDKPLKEEH